jgi:LPXTG-motif cell wall-anchored protein
MTKLVGQIVTNSDGYGALKGLAQATTYYLKETKAPDGYALPTDANNKFAIELNKDKFDTKIEATTTTREEIYTTTYATTYYTSVESEATKKDDNAVKATDKDGKQLYFAVDEKGNATDELTLEEKTGEVTNKVAYVKNQTSTVKNDRVLQTTNTSITVTEASVADDVTTPADGANGCFLNIPNTTLGALPATGGMGTYIFTIVGVCIMVCAAGLYFVNRKRRNA